MTTIVLKWDEAIVSNSHWLPPHLPDRAPSNAAPRAIRNPLAIDRQRELKTTPLRRHTIHPNLAVVSLNHLPTER